MKAAKILPLLLALMLLCSCGKGAQTDPDLPYASVNGEIITVSELDYFKTRYKADVINEYAERYGITDFSGFWERQFDGKTPAQTLEERALGEAVSAKIRLIMMRENGIYDDISYTGLLKKAQKFNSDNENASGVIGLKSIDTDSFYTYYIATGEMELKNALAEGDLMPTPEELSAAAENDPTATENSLISRIVSEKYDCLVAEKLSEAKIEILQ